MSFPSTFEKSVTDTLTDRINKLTPQTQPGWGKMNVAQMLAHCNVAYEIALEDKHPHPNFLFRLLIKAFAKKMVVGDKPYPKNSPTSPAFKIAGERDFEKEKARMIAYLNQTRELGTAHFEGKKSPGFGVLTANEWNTLFYKHLDHHLTQFGV